MAVARMWAGGRGGEEPVDEGDPLTAASRPAIVASGFHRQEPVEIGPDEGEAAALFLALATQWRHDSMSGRRTGLIYEAIRPTADMLGQLVDAARLHDLRIMEAEALHVLAARR